MTPSPDMDAIVARIVDACKPSKIVLFGSRARGDASPDSDIDLLVIKQSISNKVKEMASLRSAVGFVGFGIDILVCTPEEIEVKQGWSSSAIYWASREGKVLYEA